MYKNKSKIILIEDNSRDADLIIRSLNKHDMKINIIWLKDGEEALDYFFVGDETGEEFEYPNVILLNMNMPKVSGLDLLKEIRSSKKTRLIPVVILTSNIEDKEIEKCYNNGVNSLIIKPIDFKEFEVCITKVIAYWTSLNKTATRPE